MSEITTCGQIPAYWWGNEIEGDPPYSETIEVVTTTAGRIAITVNDGNAAIELTEKHAAALSAALEKAVRSHCREALRYLQDKEEG